MSHPLTLGSSVAITGRPGTPERLALVTAVYPDGRVDLAVFGPSATTYVRGVPPEELAANNNVDAVMEAAVNASAAAAVKAQESPPAVLAVAPAPEAIPGDPESAA